jgi:anti-sigma B factor antagonist
VERTPATGLLVTVERSEHRAVVVVAGEVEYGTAHTLRNALAEVVKDRTTELVVDLADVTFMDSTGLSLLLQVQARCETDRSRLVLRRPSARVRRLLDLSGLTDLFEIDALPT